MSIRSPVKKANSAKEIFHPPSLTEKFAQQEKRNQIDSFLNKTKPTGSSSKLNTPAKTAESSSKLNTPSKPSSRRVSLASLTDNIAKVDPPPETTDENISNKISLADVIIAAAAAKTVKLKSKGKITWVFFYNCHWV